MNYMLDTCICIEILRKQSAHILKRLNHISFDDVSISSVVLSELEHGVQKSQHKDNAMDKLNQFLSGVQVIYYDDAAAHQYGVIRANLEKKGQVIGGMDMLIAAHALSQSSTLVTNNLKEFKRVPGLVVEAW